MSTDAVQGVRDHYGGPMSDAELKFLDQIKECVGAFRRERSGFAEMTQILNDDFRSLLPFLSNLEQALKRGIGLRVNASAVPKKSSAESMDPMSRTEVEMLDDILKFIDFTIRNGLGIKFVLDVLTHDLSEIEHKDGSLDKALSKGFRPKVSGWAQLDEDSFGETEEPMEVV